LLVCCARYMRLFIYITLTVIAIFPGDLVSASFEEELKSFKKRGKCNYNVFANIDQFRWIYNQWLKPDGPWSVADNFKKLQRHNLKRYNEISEVVDSSFNTPDDFYGLQEHVRKLDGAQSEPSRLINDIRVMNYKFELSLYDLESAIVSLQRETEFLAKNCEGYEDGLNQFLKVSKLWQDDIMLYRRFIEKQRIRIENLYLVALEAARTHAFTRYIDKTNEKIDAVTAKLEAALELDRQYGVYAKWWSYLNANGLIGYGLHTRALQYRRPLQVLMSQLVEARNHHDRIARLNSDSTQKHVLNEIKFSMELIQTEIDTLKAKGWKGQWEQQKFLNQHRKVKIAPNSPRCDKSLKLYTKYASKISNEEEFSIAESYYQGVLKGCSTQPE